MHAYSCLKLVGVLVATTIVGQVPHDQLVVHSRLDESALVIYVMSELLCICWWDIE